MYDQEQVAGVIEDVRNALASDAVLSVTDHFAGYFDELGITVLVRSTTSKQELLSLKDKAASLLLGRSLPFEWMLIFERDGRQVGILFPDGMFTQ